MTQNNKKPKLYIKYYDKEETKKQYEEWMLNDKIHREDGPAFIAYYKDGSIYFKEYYLSEEFYNKEIYLNKISPQNRIKVLPDDR